MMGSVMDVESTMVVVETVLHQRVKKIVALVVALMVMLLKTVKAVGIVEVLAILMASCSMVNVYCQLIL